MDNSIYDFTGKVLLAYVRDLDKHSFYVYLVNNTNQHFDSVKMLTGGVRSTEDTILETSKVLNNFCELKPFSMIKVDDSDLDDLYFKIWYNFDFYSNNEQIQQYMAFIPYEGGNFDRDKIMVPILGKEALIIELKTRLGDTIQKAVKTLNMNSQFHDMKKRREEEVIDEFRGVKIVENAIRICYEAHGCQVRKGDGKKYYIHPIMVALKLASYGAPPDVLAAALTHDVLEDTKYPRKCLRDELGYRVLEMVEALTQDDNLSWREKKLKYIESVRDASKDVKLISVADKIHNLESLIMAHKEQGEDLWKKFNGSREDKAWFELKLLEVLENIKHPLIDEYKSLIEDAKTLK